MSRVLFCLAGEHDWRLVVVAGVICFLASLTAMNLLRRAREARGRAGAIWIVTSGVAAGGGIWATHFIAMLAYAPGVAITYDVGLTIGSLAAAVAVTAAGLGVAVHDRLRLAPVVGGGMVAAGLAGVHYLGMSAVQLPGQVAWSADLVVASIVLGMLLATAALQIAVRRPGRRAMLAAATLLTLAIVVHHFVAMGAVVIVPDPTRAIDATSLSPASLASAIAGAADALLGMSLIAAFADQHAALRTGVLDQAIEQSEERLREQNHLLDTALNNMSQGLVMFDAQTRLVICNQRYIEMYGLSPQIVKPGCTLRQLLEHRISVGTYSGDIDNYIVALRAAIAQGNTTERTLELDDGRVIVVVNQPMAGGAWVATHEDITERRRAARELDRTRTLLNSVVENMPAMLVVKEAQEYRYVLINRAGEELLGVSRDDMIGKNVYDFFPKDEADFFIAGDRKVAQSHDLLVVGEHAVHTPHNGTRILTTKKLAIFADDGEPQYLMTLSEDITERKRAEERIAHMANHDALTDLPNRSAFTERVAFTLERAITTRQPFAVLCVDLDRFKEINDVFGHATGDALLRAVARRFHAAAQGAFAARVGGDEFTFIAADGPQPSTAAALADRLMAAMTDDVEVDGHRLRMNLSIGVAIFPADGADASTILGNANAALYRAKADGRGSIRFFEADMDVKLREQRSLQQDLQSAIERGELSLHYQPQARIGGETVGFEALARWRHPTRGFVPPDVFIPLAEESGLIVPMGEWILRAACREAASWPRPLQVAVNLSPIQFERGDLANLVHAVLLETGLAPARLELEITEGVLIGDFSRAVAILRRLKSLGLRIAMDDFGTGYSSLSYLQSFPFDKIKIDQTFISNVERNPQSAAIVRAVIGLARGLNVPVVAEGVETEDQLAFLAREACDEVQGYFIGRPRPIADYWELVGRKPASRAKQAAGT